MSNVNGGTITVRVEGKDVGLTDLLARINTQMNASGATARNYATQMTTISAAENKVEQALARYTTSIAAVAAAQGDVLGSQKLLAVGLQGITTNTTAANQVLLKLQQSLNAEAAAAEKDALAIKKLSDEKAKLASATPNAGKDPNDDRTASLGRLVTAYFAATRVVKEFAQVIGEGNELEKTLTTFRVLSGSTEQYEHNLALAKAQQAQFGGSLNDTVDGMSNFANLSARTGIEIDKLTKTARALATVDPAQGFKGAGIALKEFFSGEVTSLARRFEIPREALNGLEKITDQKAKFEALSAVLEKFGISQALVEAQAGTTAVAFDKLGGAAADARAAIGSALAAAFAQTAKNITVELNAVAGAFNTIISQSQQLQGFKIKIFEQTDTKGIDQFNAKIAEVNAQLPFYAQKIQEVTPAQYAFVQALTATNVSASEAFARLDAGKASFDGLNEAIKFSGIAARDGQAAQDAFAVALGSAAAEGAHGIQFAEGLAQAVANGLPVEQAMAQIQLYKAGVVAQAAAAQAEATQVTEAALTAETLFTTALGASATEQINNKVQGDALKLTQDQLYAAALAAAQGMGATAASAAALAVQFNISAQAAYSLISAIQQLEVAKAKQDSGLSPKDFDTNAQFLQASSAAVATNKAYTDLVAVKKDNALAAADTAGKLALEREALSKLQVGSVAYEKQVGKVQAAERALQAELERDAKKRGGAPKLTPNEKINTALLDDQDKFNDKFEDAEQKHWDKVADIYEKFNEEQQKQFAKNEVSKRRSRADFYAGLQDAPAGVDTQKFAAQYEEAFAKAQEIAQSGKAKLAAEFLDLRQKQIEEMKQLDEEAAKIGQQQKEGKISKKDAQAQLEYLAGRKKLIEDAQKEEQDQLLAAGDDNQNKLNDQLTAEEKAYSDSVDKIGLTAERAADAKIKHAERSKIAVNEENKVLAAQATYYERIARLNGGQVPASARKAPVPTTTGGVQDTKDTTVDVTATNPIPVTTTDALLVRQAELFIVQDVDVMNAIGDMAARIEGKLGEVVTAVNSAKDTISTAVNSVKDAVGKIRAPSTSVVNG